MTLAELAEKERKEALACQRHGRKVAREKRVRHWAYEVLGNTRFYYELDGLQIRRVYLGVVIRLDGRKVFACEGKNITAFVDGDWVEALQKLAMAAPTKEAFGC
jgi:hypothetical protein